jgi:hypothetical protein
MILISNWQTRDLISDSVNPVCGCSCASVFNVASKVAAGEEPHATHVTHARVQPQTGSDSPKLKSGFASPKLKSSEIGRTSLSRMPTPRLIHHATLDPTASKSAEKQSAEKQSPETPQVKKLQPTLKRATTTSSRTSLQRLAEMPLHELQVAETERNEFLTVCLLGGGRTSCQPNLLCRRGSRFRVVPIDPDEENSSYEIHIAGNVVQKKIPVRVEPLKYMSQMTCHH